MADKQYTKIAIGDIGTQLFWFNQTKNTFEYALPVTAGAEFGGDTESFDAPETDLSYVPKIAGRPTLSDISYTINYTKEKYARVEEITSNIKSNIYMEVFQDGSAVVFSGKSGMPSIGSGDVRQITMTIAPDFVAVISDIYKLNEKDTKKLDAVVADENEDLETKLTLYTGTAVKIDADSIPAQRQEYYSSNK